MTERKVRARRTLIAAECFDCGKRWNTRNAHGVAVQHHDKTGHMVWVDYEMSYIYDRRVPPTGKEALND